MTKTSIATPVTLNAALNAGRARWARQNAAAAVIAELGGVATLSRGDLIRVSRMLGGVPQVRTSDTMLRTYIAWAMA